MTASQALRSRHARPPTCCGQALLGLRYRRDPGAAVRARHRHRDRRARRGARHHQVQPVRAARRDRPARHQPAHGDQRADTERPGGRAAGHRHRDDPARRRASSRRRRRRSSPAPASTARPRSRSTTPAASPRGRRTRRCSPSSAAPCARATSSTRPTSRYPVTVLGYQAASDPRHRRRRAARRPGSSSAASWFTVAGILNPLPLAPEIDRSALVGFPVAAALLGYDGHPSRIYVRTDVDATAQVAALLGPTANPRGRRAARRSASRRPR